MLGTLIIGIVHLVPNPEGGWRFMLIDDAMISMCYARSLAEGCGWVWYCGAELVQGYTNFLWTLYMAFWHFLGFSGDIGALPILLTGLITIGMQVYWLYRLGEVVGGGTIGRMSAWVGAVFFPLIRWHVSGMEAGVLAVLLTLLIPAPASRVAVAFVGFGVGRGGSACADGFCGVGGGAGGLGSVHT